ncbi:MAG TPA: hypothetical protein VKA84_14250 [Gemmatimonadaceae bacterium]|nr:hypothetical protein [Gemmatimonadaceae bacterium]
MPNKRHLKTDPIVRRSAAPPSAASPSPASDAAGRSRAARLAVIRMALVAGVLTFGGAVWLMRRRGGAPPAGAAAIETMRTFGAGVWLVALAAVVGFWLLIPRAREERRRASYTIFAWAAAEMPALFGASYYYLTGDARWFAAGLTLLVGSLLVVPGRR